MSTIRFKKKSLSQLLMATRLDRALRAFHRPSLTIFNFHRIHADEFAAPTEFDAEVFGPTADGFRSQLRWLQANATLLSEADLLSSLRESRPLPARSAMITFDDGYIDNYTVALPILKELRVPAVFFIPTQAIEERSLGWWDLIVYLLKKTNRREITLYGEKILITGNLDGARIQLQNRMKLRSAQDNTHMIQDLSEACGVELPTLETCGRELMSWEQVREAAAHGVAIGSHTHSHRVLATLDSAAQMQELLGSKTILESKLGTPVRTLAYPVGGYEHFTLETKRLAKSCGYEAAFSFHTGINQCHELDAFDIRRISAPEETVLYAGTFALPSVFAQRKCEAVFPHQVGGFHG